MLAVFARGMSNMDTHFAQDYRELMSAAGEAAHPPVIFLDIDGVLNRTSGATHIRLDQDLVSRLRTIVQRSGCRIVLSTFWRGFDAYVRYILHRHGIDAALVIGVTPGSEHGSVTPMVTERGAAQASLGLEASAHDDTFYANRAAEIRAWLAAHPAVTRFAVLDDRPSASDATLAAHFVRTDHRTGLTDDDVQAVLRILGFKTTVEAPEDPQWFAAP